MTENALPTTIQIAGEPKSFIQLYNVFAASPHGQKLVDKIRFYRYKPRSVDSDTWKSLLGADVDNLRHEKLSIGIARQFVRHCQAPDPRYWQGIVGEEAIFNPAEQAILFATAAKHDEPEAILSDISFDQKTDKDHQEEMIVMRQMLADSLKDENVSQQILEIVNDKDGETKLGRAFNAIERIGYLRTGLNAWRQACGESTIELKQGLEALTSNVFTNQIRTLLSYSYIYPAVRTYLGQNAELISSAFHAIDRDRDSFEIYERENSPTTRLMMEDLFKTSFTLWSQASF